MWCHIGTSFVYMVYKRQDSLLSWTTPQSRQSIMDDFFVFMSAYCFLFWRYGLKRLCSFPVIPWYSNLFNRVFDLLCHIKQKCLHLQLVNFSCIHLQCYVQGQFWQLLYFSLEFSMMILENGFGFLQKCVHVYLNVLCKYFLKAVKVWNGSVRPFYEPIFPCFNYWKNFGYFQIFWIYSCCYWSVDCQSYE